MAGLYNWLVRKWTRSEFSHCEIIFSDGWAASSSYLDGGVRFKRIDFDPERWDFVDLPDCMEPVARAWFESHVGQPYDLLGNLHFIVGPVPDDKRKWFCSESIAAALGMADPWRYDPGVLASSLAALSQPASTNLVQSPA